MAGADRIGILGGTFDPPHIGHLALATEVRHALDLSRVLVVVAGTPWQKVGTRAITEARHRLAMVTAAVAPFEGLEASAVEVERAGPSYTADTLEALTAPGRELVVVLGSDAAAGLPTWERLDVVRELASLAVVDRPGGGPRAPVEGFTEHRVVAPALDVSSSDLRRRVAEGRPIDVLATPAVATYVRDHRLYRGVR